MKVVFNIIKDWKKGRKWYYKYIIDGYKKNKSKYSETFIKLSKTKDVKKCKEIVKNEFEEQDIRSLSKASSLFCHLWTIVGTKEDGKKDYVEWEKYKRPSIRKLKKMLKENNYKEIKLTVVGFIGGVHMPIVRIVR